MFGVYFSNRTAQNAGILILCNRFVFIIIIITIVIIIIIIIIIITIIIIIIIIIIISINSSIPQHISVWSVKKAFPVVVDETRTVECHSLNLDRTLDISQQWQFSILNQNQKNMPEIILHEKAAHLASYIFLQEMLINIRKCKFHSSINHQEHFFTEHWPLATFV